MFLPDTHDPYIDPASFACALAFIRFYKPHKVFHLGDCVDFCQLTTSFERDPARIPFLQSDLDAAHTSLAAIRKAAPDADITLLEGNHEDRMRRYLWNVSGALASLRGLALPQLLDLRKLNIRYVESGVTSHHGFVVKHGNVVRKNSGASAKGEMESEGTSGVSGHVHRLGQVLHTNRGGTFTWLEAGCLCKMDPGYMKGRVPNWQSGLVYGAFKRANHRFTAHLLPIVKGKAVYADREIHG